MTPVAVLEAVLVASMFVTSVLVLLAGYRVLRGPSVPDRVVGLDTVSTNFVAIVALFALLRGSGFYVNAALVLAIIGFVSTVAVAKYVIEDRVVEK